MSRQHRQLIEEVFAGKADRPGLWLGNPDPETIKLYTKHFDLPDMESIRKRLGDDCRWICPEWDSYKHPAGQPIFDPYGGQPKHSHNQPGVFAECTSVAEVEAFPWPDVTFLDFTETRQKLQAASDYFRFSGMWTCFFHIVADFFGMDNYFVKMYTDPAVVQAVTEHVVDFYLAANERFFQEAADEFEIYFLGNDFGTQQDLLISPEMFHKFIMPYFRKCIDQAKSFGLKVMLHSCGSIYRVIPDLLDAGVDALHPLQARANGMDAETLARNYRGKVVFVGGVDTQDLLVNGTPQDVRDEVWRLRDLWGEKFIVSPSHEAILPNVPPENVVAMAEAAKE